jgi:hypothetical protein
MEVAADVRTPELSGFVEFADGFVARMPGPPETLGDMRYSLTPEGFDPIWGLDLGNGKPEWHMYRRKRMIGRMWRELVRPSGYLPVAAAAPG